MLLWNSTALERTSALEQVFERQHITPKEWKHLCSDDFREQIPHAISTYAFPCQRTASQIAYEILSR